MSGEMNSSGAAHGNMDGMRKEHMPRVTVIVPIYNKEHYLEECIRSIQSQTLDDLEIILMDDGSTDTSGQICDRMAKSDERIVVVHTENSGVCAARNVGLKLAKGKYIGFVDADDYISAAMYQKMANIMEEKDVDFVVCDHCRISENGHKENRTIAYRGGYILRTG